MLYRLVRPLLFQLNPELAHNLMLTALQGLSTLGRANPLAYRADAGRPHTVMGLRFPNRVGLAAGVDKNAVCVEGLAALGFGFIEVGTVTPRPQPGNPQPRLFRLPEAEAIINRMGFNNAGVESLLERLKRLRYQGILGINIGKNRATPVEQALDDYRAGLRAVYPYAGYVVINVSSPNTPGLRGLQSGENLEELLRGLMQERTALQRDSERFVPLVIKIAPDLSEAELDAIGEALIRHGIDGVIATNTTTSREGVTGLKHGDETGGLSGKPLLEKSTAAVARLRRVLGDRVPIIACGGIRSRDDAQRKLDAGADLVQLYTGLVFTGPGLVREIVGGL